MAGEKGSVHCKNTISLENGDNVPHEGNLYANANSDQNTKEHPDVIIVDWDGNDDSRNPMNWKPFQQYSQVFVVSAITLLTYVHIIIILVENQWKTQTIY